MNKPPNFVDNLEVKNCGNCAALYHRTQEEFDAIVETTGENWRVVEWAICQKFDGFPIPRPQKSTCDDHEVKDK